MFRKLFGRFGLGNTPRGRRMYGFRHIPSQPPPSNHLDKLEILNKKLGDKEAELEEFFNLCPDLFGIAHEDGTLVDVNPAWVETLGYDKEEVLAAGPFSNVDQEDTARSESAASWMKHVPIKGMRLKMIRKDGGVRWIDWSASAWKDGRAYIAGHDVTHRMLAKLISDQAKT